ncbi:MAG: NfeD family protein [Dehalococcoidales bacterium]|nr:NfeD family protein [Dehalococcoidales bacterium]
MDGETLATFTDEWMWLIFVSLGLILVILELLAGIDTGLDLVFIGSAFVIGGLITWPFTSWIATLIVTAVICIAYVFIGRKYIHRRTAVELEKTNIDAVIGSRGIVLRSILRNEIGRVKVGNERWRARSDDEIEEGMEIIVTGVTGNTLFVKKSEGGKN